MITKKYLFIPLLKTPNSLFKSHFHFILFINNVLHCIYCIHTTVILHYAGWGNFSDIFCFMALTFILKSKSFGTFLPINPFKKSCCGYFINASLNGPKFCVLYYIHTCILSLLQCSTPIVWNSVVHFLHFISF